MAFGTFDHRDWKYRSIISNPKIDPLHSESFTHLFVSCFPVSNLALPRAVFNFFALFALLIMAIIFATARASPHNDGDVISGLPAIWLFPNGGLPCFGNYSIAALGVAGLVGLG